MSLNSLENADLKNVQEWMLNSLTTPMGLDSNSISEHILPAANISAAASLAIYQRSYILRLRKCLAEQFPATCYALGEQLFSDFADAYLLDYPSQSHTLYDLGNSFSRWLEENRIDKDLPEDQKELWIDFMVDLADYEQSLFKLFDAQGSDQETLATNETPDDQLQLQSIFVLKQYRYQVAQFYHDVRDGKNPELPLQASQRLALIRVNYQTYSFPINHFQYRFLFELQITQDVEQALKNIASQIQAPMEQVQQSWRNDVRKLWIDAGFFIEI